MNLIFPIAGKGERFNCEFKPFLQINGITFIEKTISSFPNIENYNIFFICTEEQNIKYNVKNTLDDILKNIAKFTLITIPKQTTGPLQTIIEGLKIHSITGPSIICDCDIYLDATDILNLMETNKFDIIIPSYNISEQDFDSWSKIIFDNNNHIIKIIEKEPVLHNYKYRGIIGCIGIKNIEHIINDINITNMNYISEYLDYKLKQKYIITDVLIDNCLLYGDINKYNRSLEILRSKSTIFCDIDGVLLKHCNTTTYDLNQNILLDGYQYLDTLKKDGHKIVLTTARPAKDRIQLEKLLQHYKIMYNDIIMGCNTGSRIIINDRKPSKPFQKQAVSLEVSRDVGIKNFNINEYYEEFFTQIIKQLDGHSFAKTYLIQKDNTLLIRKYIQKSHTNYKHYVKLKRQYSDLQRLQFLNNNLVPNTIMELDNQFEYFFDIEYLENFDKLSNAELDIQLSMINAILYTMNNDIYAIKKNINGKQWLEQYLKNKIYSTINDYEYTDQILYTLFNQSTIQINDHEYLGLKNILHSIKLSTFYPQYISPIHGDMTLENILYFQNEWKLIDMDGSDIFDAPEQDIGKIFQSILGRYHQWSNMDIFINHIKSDSFSVSTNNFFNIPNDISISDIQLNLSKIFNKSNIIQNGVFFMCCHFIRMLPFRMKVNRTQAYFCIIMAIIWLNKLINNKI